METFSHSIPLQAIEFRPCICVMLAGPKAFRVPEPGCLWLKKDHGLEWISDNQQKGISPHPSLSIHLNEAMSSKLYDKLDAEILQLTKQLAEQFISDEIDYESVHRWRFSQPKIKPKKASPILISDPLPLVLTGDAFSGGRVEGAFMSGYRAAGMLLKIL